MPWNPKNLNAMREEFVRLAVVPGANKRELMRRFGISPPTAYKWIGRFEKAGSDGLSDRSRKPAKSPDQTSAAMEGLIVAVRKEFPDWGARKLGRILQNRGTKAVPALSTITAVLRRNGLLDAKLSAQKTWKRFERASPNELWQMDFKGDFLTGDGKRCYPLTACDDNSRFNLILKACTDMRTGTVASHLREAFESYGLPQAILCDNGSPWASNWTGGRTKLEVWLMLLGVKMSHGRPYHPQTQGKEERFHRTLKTELLRRCEGFADNAACQVALGEWRTRYNWIRPHEALDLDVPGKRYKSSNRSMPEKVPSAEEWYGDDTHTRKVQKTGTVEFLGKRLLVGEAFAGHRVALRYREADLWELFFASYNLDTYDLSESPPGGVGIRSLARRKADANDP